MYYHIPSKEKGSEKHRKEPNLTIIIIYRNKVQIYEDDY